jgi:hypothetical protein
VTRAGRVGDEEVSLYEQLAEQRRKRQKKERNPGLLLVRKTALEKYTERERERQTETHKGGDIRSVCVCIELCLFL